MLSRHRLTISLVKGFMPPGPQSGQTLRLNSLTSFLGYSFSFSHSHSENRDFSLVSRLPLRSCWPDFSLGPLLLHIGAVAVSSMMSSPQTHPIECYYLVCLNHCNACKVKVTFSMTTQSLSDLLKNILVLGVFPTWIFAVLITLLYLLSSS